MFESLVYEGSDAWQSKCGKFWFAPHKEAWKWHIDGTVASKDLHKYYCYPLSKNVFHYGLSSRQAVVEYIENVFTNYKLDFSGLKRCGNSLYHSKEFGIILLKTTGQKIGE